MTTKRDLQAKAFEALSYAGHFYRQSAMVAFRDLPKAKELEIIGDAFRAQAELFDRDAEQLEIWDDMAEYYGATTTA